MAIRIERVGDVAVVFPEGRFIVGPEIDELNAALEKLLLEERCPKILLDMGGMEFLSSTSIGVIVWAYSQARKHDRTLWLCGMAKRIRSVFDLLDSFGPDLKVFDAREEALQAFEQL
jgi:anti-anti-sigma factor